MTNLFKEAIAKVSTLPEAAQEKIGEELLVHVEKLHRLRAKLDKGIRSLDHGEGRSGADNIILPAYIADLFGIDKSACPTYSVVGISLESTPAFTAELGFRLQDHSEVFTAPVVFIDNDVPPLLGQEGFFDNYRIKFEKDHDTFEIASPPRR